MSALAAPIMVRARITRDEWEALRILALRQNTAPADLIAAAIRSAYPNLTSQEAPNNDSA